MKTKLVFGIVLTLLLVGTLTSAFNLAIAGVAGEDEMPSPVHSGPPSLIWSKTFGGDAEDEPYCARQTSDGGYILAGHTYSFGAGDADAWIVKTDANGNMEWSETYGRETGDTACDVRQTSDGGYILAGYSMVSDTLKAGGNLADVWLIKIDASGNVEWKKTYYRGAAWLYWPSSVQYTSDGGYIFVGSRYYLTKTDANGNMEWRKDISGGRDSYARALQQTSDDGYIIAGYLSGSLWLVKTDTDGNVEWDRIYGGFGDARGYYGQQTTDGGYMLAGRIILSGGLDTDYLLVKTDADGNMEWNNTYGTHGGLDHERLYSGMQTSDGGYVLAGWTQRTGKVWLVKTDADGNMEWNATYGGGGWYATSIQRTSDGGYIVAGSTSYYGAIDDFFLMKLGIKHDVAVTDVQPSNNVVAQNQSISINVTVENQGDSTETFNVTAYASTTTIDTFRDVTLTWRNSTILTFTWNTTGFIEGVYIISATVTPVPDEPDTADNTYADGPVIVGAGPPGNSIWINPPLTDNLQEGDTFAVDLMINVTDPDGPGPATGLWGFQYKLAWDPTKIDILDITYHNPWSPSYSWVVRNETGVLPDGRHYHWLVIGALSPSAPFTGIMSLCTYTFYVNYQSYYPDPDYNGILDICDDELVDDTATLFAYTIHDGQYRIPSKVPATVDIDSNPLNLKRREWITYYIELPEGYNVSDIDIYSIRLNDTFPVSLLVNPPEIGDYDDDGIPDLMVKFNGTMVSEFILSKGITYGNVTLKIIGNLTDGTQFEGEDTVKVLIPGDLDHDDDVDHDDFILFCGSYPSKPPLNPEADLDGDGDVDSADFILLVGNYGKKL